MLSIKELGMLSIKEMGMLYIKELGKLSIIEVKSTFITFTYIYDLPRHQMSACRNS